MQQSKNMINKSTVEALWRICFNDNEEFIRLFFDNIYNPENVIAIEQNGDIVSALHILPYTIDIGGKETQAAYICGVGTLPYERGKGHMSRLMKLTDEVLKRRNIPISFIIPAEPWLFDIYEKYGYKKAFGYNREKLFISERNSLYGNITLVTGSSEAVFAYFDKKQRERRNSVLHDEKDLAIIVKDLVISGGGLFIARGNQNEIIGLAFAVPDENAEALVNEFMYDDIAVRQDLLNSIATKFDSPHITIISPALTKTPTTKGMVKLIKSEETFPFETTFMNLMLD